MKQLLNWLAYLCVRMFICVIQSMRLESCHVVARWLAVVACDVVPVRRRVVDENLKHVFPELSAHERRRLARQMWEHLFLMVCEIAHIPRKIHETNWRQHIHLKNNRAMVGYLLDDRPTVVVSGHFGNFELASYSLGLLGFPSYSIARRLDNPYLHDFVNQFRSANGQFILPKDGSGNKVNEVLKAGGTLALLGDQHAGQKGCWVDFLGRPAPCHKALAVFTLSGRAPLLVSYARRLGHPLQFEIGLVDYVDPEYLDDSLGGVRPLTQWYNHMLEKVIRESPEQYWWVHRRWKGEPPQRKSRRRQAA